MKKLERWDYSGAKASGVETVEDLARYAAEDDKRSGCVLDNFSEVYGECAEFFEGDHIVELGPEEWPVFVDTYLHHLGVGL